MTAVNGNAHKLNFPSKHKFGKILCHSLIENEPVSLLTEKIHILHQNKTDLFASYRFYTLHFLLNLCFILSQILIFVWFFCLCYIFAWKASSDLSVTFLLVFFFWGQFSLQQFMLHDVFSGHYQFVWILFNGGSVLSILCPHSQTPGGSRWGVNSALQTQGWACCDCSETDFR